MRENHLTPEDSETLKALHSHLSDRAVRQLGNQWKNRDPSLDFLKPPSRTWQNFVAICMLVCAFILFYWPPLTPSMNWFTIIALVLIAVVALIKFSTGVTLLIRWHDAYIQPYNMENFLYQRIHAQLLLAQWHTEVNPRYVSLVILLTACFFTCWPLCLLIGLAIWVHLHAHKQACWRYKQALEVLATQ
jgi:high-affinity Fe2+/Pb2+ permease